MRLVAGLDAALQRAITAAVVALAFAAPLDARGAPDADTGRRLLQLTNDLRTASGWKAVVREPRLTAAAARLAQYMAQTDRYGHGVDGRQPADRATAQGYDHCLVSENIAFASSTRGLQPEELARRLFEGWARSPPHRRNMLDGDMTEVGIAVAQSARSGRHYAVQLFGRPRSLAVRIELANRSRVAVHYDLAGERYELKPNVVRTHERCRRELLAVTAEGLDEESAKPITVAPGARYRIEDSADGVRLRRD